jgi:hypothetical protein
MKQYILDELIDMAKGLYHGQSHGQFHHGILYEPIRESGYYRSEEPGVAAHHPSSSCKRRMAPLLGRGSHPFAKSNPLRFTPPWGIANSKLVAGRSIRTARELSHWQ